MLFANYFRPACVQVPSLATVLADMGAQECRNPRAHYGLYPFRWAADWEQEADRFFADGGSRLPIRLAPVLERLVFPRARACFLDWLADLGQTPGIRQLVSAHYHAPQPLQGTDLAHYAEVLRQREWAPSEGSWQTLAAIDQTLVRLGVVGRT